MTPEPDRPAARSRPLEIPPDPRFESGIPASQRGNALDFIQMTGLTRPVSRDAAPAAAGGGLGAVQLDACLTPDPDLELPGTSRAAAAFQGIIDQWAPDRAASAAPLATPETPDPVAAALASLVDDLKSAPRPGAEEAPRAAPDPPANDAPADDPDDFDAIVASIDRERLIPGGGRAGRDQAPAAKDALSAAGQLMETLGQKAPAPARPGGFPYPGREEQRDSAPVRPGDSAQMPGRGSRLSWLLLLLVLVLSGAGAALWRYVIAPILENGAAGPAP